MAWKKSPPELIRTFENARPDDPSVEARKMFGYPAFFTSGRMFAGTYQEKVVVRFGEDRSLAGVKTAKTFEPMPGRPMTGFVVVPDAVVRSPPKLREWIAHAHAYTQTLPAKRPAPSGRAASARKAAKTPAPRARAARSR